MWLHYVYTHRKADTGEVFYVGKGTARTRKRQRFYERALDTSSRSKWWQRVVNKHGFIAEVVASCVDDAASQSLERELIASYGRANLVNLTDGGDGCAGIIASKETRRKISANSSRPRSQAWIDSIRRSRKGGGNGGVVKPGDKLPQWWRDRIAAATTGTNNPMYGRTGGNHPNSRRVIDTETGVEYPSVTAAAKSLGLRMQTLHNMLTGFRRNWTTMRFE